MTQQRARLRIGGMVQGVGFRPYVYRLARALELTGFVRNDARGVLVEVEGTADAVDRFVERLPVDSPPLAVCERIEREALTLLGGTTFRILVSEPDRERNGAGSAALVAPDVATCDDCLRELLDPSDRRYRYPFINCTNCGPRYTIVRGVPYDRALTTMAAFRMCAACQSEYDDPADRRFHAQPNACPECGPAVRLLDADGTPCNTGGAADAIATAAAALLDGQILAVKGVGGYHLACLARDEPAVRRLRERKHRPDKPLALMAPNEAWARRLVELDGVEESLLMARERPIVLARRRVDAPVADSVAPRQRELGVMLPYSPLHHLLLTDIGEPLVMTSGNVSDEPLAFRDDDALLGLRDLADLFLVHNRPIEMPTDDSVVRVMSVNGRRATMVRRSRGYAPSPLALPVAAPVPMLACGGQLKNTYAVASGAHAWVGPHVGDLGSFDALCAFAAGVDHHQRLFSVAPERIVHDRHPEYASTKYAVARVASGRHLSSESVQHHHAHMAACLAEHGECGPAIGVLLDGTGLGAGTTAGAVEQTELWGGEILVGDLESFERVGHLWPVRMAGGEAAIREPWRMAAAWLTAISCDELPGLPMRLTGIVSAGAWRAAAQLARSGVASPWTSSAGRLLDGLSALCGVRVRVSYEGQAAIEFEAQADRNEYDGYPMPVSKDASGGSALILDGRELVRAVQREVVDGVSTALISARVHNGMAYAAAECCRVVADRTGLTTVVLSGGVFQNALLVERTAAELRRTGLRVLIPERLPCNDGGLAYGQVAVAAARAAHTLAVAASARGVALS